MKTASRGSTRNATATVWLSLALLASPSLAQTEPEPGFSVIEPLLATVWPAAKAPRAISATARPVLIDLQGLTAARQDDRIELELDGARVRTVVDRVDRRSDRSWSLACHLESDPGGFALFSIEGDAVAALIQAPSLGALYQIGYVASGVHELTRVEQPSIPDCNTVEASGGTEPGSGPGSTPGSTPDSPPTLPQRPAQLGGCLAPRPNGDVMIFYTASARLEAGGVNAMDAACQLAVDVANQTYVASSITNQLTLIFRGELAYTEAGDLEIDRNRLTGTSDGFMDHVHPDRNYYGSDYVTLFVRHSDASGCGIAYCLPNGAAQGFCVVDWTCASSNFSFAHEIGHLQGCAHNHEDAGSGCNQNCYSFGHRFFGNSGSGWRTVMAYDNEDSDFSRIGIWSNPDILFDGQPCGVWSGDCGNSARSFNAATVTNTALDRESWRNPKFDVWVDLSAPSPWTGAYARPFPDLPAGIQAIFQGGSTPAIPVLRLKANDYPGPLTLTKPMRIVSCGGVASIGG